jgi:GR25 family glycosyltransferase involved in LPS biosynthesis
MKRKVLESFDAAYFINLNERTDRRIQAEAELRRIGVIATRIPAFRPDSSFSHGRLSLGQYGCKVSHIDAILNGIRERYDSILIIEDDVQFNPQFLEYVEPISQAMKRLPWDLFFFYATSNRRFEPVAPKVYRVATSLPHCYAIHSRAYFRVLHEPIDLIYRSLATSRDLNVFAPACDLAVQREGYSDILEKSVDHTQFHLERFGT